MKGFQMRQLCVFSARRSGLWAGACLAFLTLGACQKKVSSDIESRMLAEFEGAFPTSAPKGSAVREFDLEAAETEVSAIDGSKRRLWTYNGQTPGPTLRIKLGETLRVRFKNSLPQPTTIHWHGVRLPNAMDGVPHLTQPPIAPGASFTYEFTPKDAGTFWFHPHVRGSEQVERGLYGVLIVEDTQTAPYSRDLVWVLDDWLLNGDGSLFERFNTPHDLSHDGRWGNVITVNGKTPEALQVRPGERIRLRLVNSANGRVFVPDFGDLPIEVIAVDGTYLRAPMPLERMELAPGNRLDLDLQIPPTRFGRYEVTDRFSARRVHPLATVEVSGEPAPLAKFETPAHAKVPTWSEWNAVPPASTFRLNARRGGEYGIEWTFNGKASTGHQHGEAPALTLKGGRWARLQFVNESGRLHPIHLHGMFFRLLGRNGQSVNEPFFRDTVLVHPRETVDIGLVPLDPGDWMMHCHILEHEAAGMMTTLRVTPQ